MCCATEDQDEDDLFIAQLLGPNWRAAPAAPAAEKTQAQPAYVPVTNLGDHLRSLLQKSGS